MIFGLEPKSVPPDAFTPLEAVTILKCLDDEGDVTLWLTSTPGLTGWERIGVLTCALDVSRAATQSAFEADNDTDDAQGDDQ